MPKKKYRYAKVDQVGDFLIIDSSIDNKAIASFIESNQIENLSFNQYDGFSGDGLSSYALLPSVKRIEVITNKVESSQLIKFENLVYLYLSVPFLDSLDLATFKYLEYLNIEWNNKIKNLNRLSHLKELVLRKYKGKQEELAQITSLEKLSFIQGNIKSLEFIKSLEKLNSFSISYCRALEKIDSMANIPLEELEIDNCKKIDYGESLSKLRNLKKLIITNSAPIRNLDFITNLKSLRFLSFVETEIKDGNIKPCIGVDYVGFDEKRNYNCRNIDGKAVLKVSNKA